jgi:hypothetical protein
MLVVSNTEFSTQTDDTEHSRVSATFHSRDRIENANAFAEFTFGSTKDFCGLSRHKVNLRNRERY